MVGAVVQVLVAEQTAPALVALALPWLLAGSVDTARIRLALRTKRASPASVAPEQTKRERR